MMTPAQALTLIRQIWGPNARNITPAEVVRADEEARERGLSSGAQPLSVFLAAAGIPKTAFDYTSEADWFRRRAELMADVRDRANDLGLESVGNRYIDKGGK